VTPPEVSAGGSERSASAAVNLLRRGLLEGSAVVLARAGHAGDAGDAGDAGTLAAHAQRALGDLGARVWACEVAGADGAAGEQELDAEARRALDACGRVDMLAVDAAGVFDAAGASRRGLAVCLQATWNVTRALANAALVPQGGGRIAYLAPAPGAGPHARAARAGLENLGRTLSIEWARHAITAVTIAPGARTEPDDVAALVAYLCSPAGAYFSGCLLDLTGDAAPADGPTQAR
jgi:NAD(P)-dependent dehydrogenase (short-subunit alcohol dehydrogenase family)